MYVCIIIYIYVTLKFDQFRSMKTMDLPDLNHGKSMRLEGTKMTVKHTQTTRLCLVVEASKGTWKFQDETITTFFGISAPTIRSKILNDSYTMFHTIYTYIYNCCSQIISNSSPKCQNVTRFTSQRQEYWASNWMYSTQEWGTPR
jgi:hypothetical protein